MPEPITILGMLGGLVTALASGVAANEAHRLYLKALDQFANDSLDEFGLPRNHDLMRASEDALREAVRLLLLQLENELVQRKPWVPRFLEMLRSGRLGRVPFIDYGKDPRGPWLKAVSEALHSESFHRLHDRDLNLDDQQVRACFEKDGVCRLFDAHICKLLLDWLRDEGERSGGDVPEKLESFVREGWPLKGGNTISVSQAYCLFFREHLKSRPEVFRILTTDFLLETGEQIKHLPEEIGDLFERELAPIIAQLEAIELSLAEANTAITRLHLDQTDLRIAVLDSHLSLHEQAESIRAELMDGLRGYHEAFKFLEAKFHTISIRRPDVPRPPKENDLHLLHAKHRSIPLRGRDEDMHNLWRWLEGDDSVSARLLIGRAGAGKTRLAFELIWRTASTFGTDWAAGVVHREDLVAYNENHAWGDLAWEKPTLLVIDNAQALQTQLGRLFVRLAEVAEDGSDRPKLRVLLLDREADAQAGWFSELLNEYSSLAGGPVSGIFDPAIPVPVTRLSAPELRLQVFTDTLHAIGQYLNRTPRPIDTGTRDEFLAKLAEDRWGDPLYLMMAAFVGFHSETWSNLLHFGRTELAHAVATREARRLTAFVQAEPGDADGKLLCHLAAIATFRGGLQPDEQLPMIKAELEALGLGWPRGPGALKTAFLSSMAATENGAIAPIQPDIIAEAFILDHLGAGNAAEGDAALLRAATLDAPNLCRRLCHAIQNFDTPESTGDKKTLTRWLDLLVEAARNGRKEILNALDAAIPFQTLSLAAHAAELAEIRYAAAKDALSDEAVKPEEELATLGRSAASLANRLSALARNKEALEVGDEAVGVFRDLVVRNSDVYLPDFGSSLDVIAPILHTVGRRDKAFNAVLQSLTIRRELVRRNRNAYLFDFAISLSNFGTMLAAVGRPKPALDAARDALETYRKLVERNRDAYLPYLGRSLSFFGVMLRENGRLDQALDAAHDALNISRDLVQRNSDAYLPDLGRSLRVFGAMLNAAGRRNEALDTAHEIVETYRKLVERNCDAYLPELAMSLNSLGIFLGAAERPDAALDTAREAVETYRKLVERNGDTHLAGLGMSLYNFGKLLSDAGRHEEAIDTAHQALDATREVVTTCRESVERDPDVYLPVLETALSNYTKALSAVGRKDEALAAANEMCEIRHELEDLRNQGRLLNFATSSGTKAFMSRREESWKSAAESFVERDHGLTSNPSRDPQAFGQCTMDLVRDHLAAAKQAGIEPDLEKLGPVLEYLQRKRQGGSEESDSAEE